VTFTADLYDTIRPGAQSSAAVVGEILNDLFDFERVIDVGCGEGWWGSELASRGRAEAVGVETENVPQPAPHVTRHQFDLTVPGVLAPLGAFDLAICLEVAEHLPESAADTLIDSLCAAATTVIFSAAIPGQGGHGHVNEQWPAYWVRKFEERGYEVSGDLRWHVWGNDQVEPWYQQNMLVAMNVTGRNKQPYAYNELFGEHAFQDPIAVVHPITFSHHVQLARRSR
jgi:hypothetical protein